jgi:hypothetical protein
MMIGESMDASVMSYDVVAASMQYEGAADPASGVT